MRRRNFLLGLGVLGAGSGSVTLAGATLSETVTPTVGFRINVEGGLEVSAGKAAGGHGHDTGNNSIDDTNDTIYNTTSSAGDSTFTNTLDGAVDNYRVIADQEINGDFDLGVAIPYETPGGKGIKDVAGAVKNDEGHSALTTTLFNVMTIKNNTSSSQDVVISYYDGNEANPSFSFSNQDNHGYNTDSDLVNETSTGSYSAGGGPVDPAFLSVDEVAHLIGFYDGSNGDKVSPEGEAVDDGTDSNKQSIPNNVTIASGAETTIDMKIKLTEANAEKIVAYIENKQYDIFSRNAGQDDTIFIEDLYIGV
jgi:hypothetical protein